MSEETKLDLSFLEPFKGENCGKENCGWCEFERPMWESIHATLNAEQSAFLEAFQEQAAYDSTDAAWAQGILDGDWPGSIEILTEALEKAKKFNALTPEEQTVYWENKMNEAKKKEIPIIPKA